MKLPLCYLGHPALRTRAKEIGEITPEIRQLASDMIETMKASNGVGLAANQVGVLQRIFIICDEKMGPGGEIELGESEVMINPILSEPSGVQEGSEGCLSIPGLFADVSRPLQVKVRYTKLSGEIVEEVAEGFRARVIMHENDHLNGVLFIDRLPPDLRKKVEPELRLIKKKYSIS
jgi:peptide deformylase